MNNTLILRGGESLARDTRTVFELLEKLLGVRFFQSRIGTDGPLSQGQGRRGNADCKQCQFFHRSLQ